MKTHYRKKVSKKNLYREVVKVLNGLLELSGREAEVLSLLMSLDATWIPAMEADIKDIFSTDSRRALMKETRINKNNLTKYLSILKGKGLITVADDGGHQVNPMIMPKDTSGIIEIVFTLDIENQ